MWLQFSSCLTTLVQIYIYCGHSPNACIQVNNIYMFLVTLLRVSSHQKYTCDSVCFRNILN